jgi:hypothetical protein
MAAMMVSGNSAVMRKAMLDALSLPAFILLLTMMGFGSLARCAYSPLIDNQPLGCAERRFFLKKAP